MVYCILASAGGVIASLAMVIFVLMIDRGVSIVHLTSAIIVSILGFAACAAEDKICSAVSERSCDSINQ